MMGAGLWFASLLQAWRSSVVGLLVVPGAIAALPTLVSLVDPPWFRTVFGREGYTEAVTAGLLAGLAWESGRERQPWIALFSLLLLAEELDYGQLFLGYATPASILALGANSDRLNFHNLPMLEWLWRPLPMLAVVTLSQSLGDYERWRKQFFLPSFSRAMLPSLVLLLLGSSLNARFADDAYLNEATELSLVMWVLLGARFPPRSERLVADAAPGSGPS